MALKQLPDDFRDFLSLLVENHVKYLLLGGWAVGIYGHPRATGDLDIIITTDERNLDNLQKALFQFGAPTVDKSQFKEVGNIFRMGRSPIMIDIINEADGIEFETCYKRRNQVLIDDLVISVISKKDLIENKMASARAKDLADVESLQLLSDNT